jgi:hypothetical protein
VTAHPHPAASAGRHPLGTVYPLPFDQRYERAGHYTGKPASSGLLKGGWLGTVGSSGARHGIGPAVPPRRGPAHPRTRCVTPA